MAFDRPNQEEAGQTMESRSSKTEEDAGQAMDSSTSPENLVVDGIPGTTEIIITVCPLDKLI
jgi:hypothetical protein